MQIDAKHFDAIDQVTLVVLFVLAVIEEEENVRKNKPKRDKDD